MSLNICTKTLLMPVVAGVSSYIIFTLSSWSLNTDYDSETDDDNGELENSPPAKRQKLDVREESSGSSASPSSKNTTSKDESCLPFLLSRVRGIPSEFNARNLAIGIKGIWAHAIEYVHRLNLSCDLAIKILWMPLWTKEKFKRMKCYNE